MYVQMDEMDETRTIPQTFSEKHNDPRAFPPYENVGVRGKVALAVVYGLQWYEYWCHHVR